MRYPLVIIVCCLMLHAGLVRSQSAVPVDCPTIYDAAGTRVGLIQATGSIATATIPQPPHLFNETVARVALQASGEVFVVDVTRTHFRGTLMFQGSLTVVFETPDCTGVAYGGGAVAGSSSSMYRWEDIGPFAPTVVAGPRSAVYVLDGSVPRQTITPQSYWSTYESTPADPGTCLPYAGVGFPPVTSRPMRKVAELSPDYQPPFHVEEGPCPRPGRR